MGAGDDGIGVSRWVGKGAGDDGVGRWEWVQMIDLE